MLVSEWPDAIKSTSGNGNLPLHVACSKRRSIPILRLLVGSPDNDDPVVDEEEQQEEEEQEEDDLRNAVNADGLTPWEIIKKESRFWEVIYRMRARKLLKVSLGGKDDRSIVSKVGGDYVYDDEDDSHDVHIEFVSMKRRGCYQMIKTTLRTMNNKRLFLMGGYFIQRTRTKKTCCRNDETTTPLMEQIGGTPSQARIAEESTNSTMEYVYCAGTDRLIIS